FCGYDFGIPGSVQRTGRSHLHAPVARKPVLLTPQSPPLQARHIGGLFVCHCSNTFCGYDFGIPGSVQRTGRSHHHAPVARKPVLLTPQSPPDTHQSP
ncbi:MAG: hypothetical protein Q4G62_12505, partial [Pseudomonadota bacterium]|nr:hypothetical protein [Pseudomonadota bacterium]